MAASGHLVLARKYRPQRFSEVVEQPSAVRSLTNALQQQRLASAYLFFGPRGVGKTTLARILAKRVNCRKPDGDEPCNECDSCLSILSGNSLDVLEIDAASHRGIQHIRELRENVQFRPMSSVKKVYIIDEVHMLTTESFNALLKTLEEPPEHALFVLATTEFNKVPETILSRCQVFTFRKAPLATLQAYLKELCDREGIRAEDEALFWIARRGDGSIRDSLSFMEQAMTYSGGDLTAAQVKELIGAMPADLFIHLTEALLDPAADETTLLQPVHEIFSLGGDMQRFVWEYLDFVRILIHVRKGVESSEFLGIPGTEVHELRKRFAAVDPEQLVLIFRSVYSLLSKGFALKLRNSYESRVLVEVELIGLREQLNQPSLSSVLGRLNRLSAAIQDGRSYSPENELQKQFLGTIDGNVTRLED